MTEPSQAVLLLVSDLLPPNMISVSIRRVNRACRQRYADNTAVDCKAWLPVWAVQEGVEETARRSRRRSKQEKLNGFWRAIVASGDLDNLQLLAASGGSAWGLSVYTEAAECGHVHVMDWALKNHCPIRFVPDDDYSWDELVRRFSSMCTMLAAEHGHIPVLEWLEGVGCFSAFTVCNSAAEGGHLHVLRWACSRTPPYPWNARTTSIAARHGHLAVLQWLRRHGCPWDKSMCFWAARAGHQDIIQWARENGCPWDSGTCLAAGMGGHLALLEWARASGCPCLLDEGFAMDVAICNQLRVLQWARGQEPPCPWDSNVTYVAALNKHVELLRWAVANGCPYAEDTFQWVKRHKLRVRLPGYRRYCIISNTRQCAAVAVRTISIVGAIATVVSLVELIRHG